MAIAMVVAVIIIPIIIEIIIFKRVYQYRIVDRQIPWLLGIFLSFNSTYYVQVNII